MKNVIKKLGIFEGYQHPTLGKKHLVCGSCFEQVEESVTKWREFIFAHPVSDAHSTPLDFPQPKPVKAPLYILLNSLFGHE